MFALKSRLVTALVIVAALTLPAAVEAHPGGGMGHGSGGGVPHGGMGHRHGWHQGWGGWSWGVPWGWTAWDYPVDLDLGNSAAWQQGYSAALQQAQWAMLQQQQAALNQRQIQKQAPERNLKANVKRVAPQQGPRPAATYEVTTEERAAGKLKLAMLLADAGKTADAAEFCRDLVEQYPGTPAAQQAKVYLSEVR